MSYHVIVGRPCDSAAEPQASTRSFVSSLAHEDSFILKQKAIRQPCVQQIALPQQVVELMYVKAGTQAHCMVLLLGVHRTQLASVERADWLVFQGRSLRLLPKHS